MNKIIILLILLQIVLPLNVFADNEENISEQDVSENEKEPFRIKDRFLEIGFLQTRAGLSNDHFISSDIFKEKLVIDLGDFSGGLRINADLGFVPLYFTYNKDDQWGFGLSLGVDAVGIINLSGNLLTLSEAGNDSSFAGGAAFAEAKFSGFFKKYNFKIKINPSLYYPVIYLEGDPNIFYSFSNALESSAIELQYNLLVHTGFQMEDDSSFKLTASPGIDIHLGAEYPLAEVLGLKEKYKFLDFIVGVDFINIPLIPSQMKNYINISGQIGDGTPLSEIEDFSNFLTINEPVYGSINKFVLRPFKMLAWADWKPFDAIPISFIPTLGFSISPLYEKPASMEAGIKVRYDHANLFIASLGIGYFDRTWKNSLDIALNFRYFEFDIGVEMRSQDFAKSWQGSGLGVYIGFKAGG
ncbi:MAG: hypothetical protein FWB77_02520 [Treponema sp.]|nr:hypothetical protein [Treponema sp.]